MHKTQQQQLLAWNFTPDSKPKAWRPWALFPSEFIPSSLRIPCFPKVPVKNIDRFHEFCSAWAPVPEESASWFSNGYIQAGLNWVIHRRPTGRASSSLPDHWYFTALLESELSLSYIALGHLQQMHEFLDGGRTERLAHKHEFATQWWDCISSGRRTKKPLTEISLCTI